MPRPIWICLQRSFKKVNILSQKHTNVSPPPYNTDIKRKVPAEEYRIFVTELSVRKIITYLWTRLTPPVGSYSPSRIFSKVVLPDPFSPNTAILASMFALRSTFSNIFVPATYAKSTYTEKLLLWRGQNYALSANIRLHQH